MLCFNTGDREHHVWIFKQCPANDPFRFEHVSQRLEACLSKKALLEFRLIWLARVQNLLVVGQILWEDS